MVIFFEEIMLQLFLWTLYLVDGLCELFSAIAGVIPVRYEGRDVNIIESAISNNTVTNVFWCVFILAIGLLGIFTIAAIIKNIITNGKTTSQIAGKFFLSLIGTLAMLSVVILGILIVNSTLKIVAETFRLNTSAKLSGSLFGACVGDWLNGYSVSEIDVSKLSVREIFGDYNTAAFGIWPSAWKYNGMVNPDTFLYLPAFISSLALLIALFIAVINLAKRVYEIVFMYLILPLSMSTLPLDDGARFKIWRETFISKLLLAYGSLFSVNIFVILLPVISRMQVSGLSQFGNSLFLIIMIIGGALVIPAGQSMFARLFGQADDMRAGGGFMSSLFYGSRMVTAMTLGTTRKMLKGMFGLGRSAVKGIKNRQSRSAGGNNNDSNKPQTPMFTYTYTDLGSSDYTTGGNDNANNT